MYILNIATLNYAKCVKLKRLLFVLVVRYVLKMFLDRKRVSLHSFKCVGKKKNSKVMTTRNKELNLH